VYMTLPGRRVVRLSLMQNRDPPPPGGHDHLRPLDFRRVSETKKRWFFGTPPPSGFCAILTRKTSFCLLDISC
jgi:hypothetical protein